MTLKEDKKESPLLYILTGATSGLVADSLMHPIDTIRARIQIEKVGKSQYRGTFHALNHIIKNEGASYLYKGFPIVATATVPAHALYFLGYEYSKSLMIDKLGPKWGDSAISHFTAGFIADALGSLVWVPMDIIKQRLQVQTNTQKLNPNQTYYKGSFHAAKVIMKEEGVKGFYRGFMPALLTYGPFVGIYFSVYEKCKSFISSTLHYSPDQYLPIPYQLGSGFFAGAFAAAVTCPLDVIKTRIQVQRSTEKQIYKGMFDSFKTILKEEGPKAFVKGMGTRILWIAPGNALTIASYEQLKYLFKGII
ncbi:hypothetical protein DICPUDRAFT_85907 [Dictyostelium purpureum]|uniref:Mitochondrial substrate carrier family protein n=1 Tax=Dictyostelium purpureum TaxID=5786 RepID=F0Z850_DICPU|nr:uncharacterized protein DICPUDRAFT_85907 [Dictyostelium purpureum]EGC39867.1 hypothetical protein DICPUDRAFT_85907 [Dictyostelium purpureum]|eukprot:XP_003283618.1 hypothetical protein DICPUDRAFT_85907 [Dictyostelium purpureum]